MRYLPFILLPLVCSGHPMTITWSDNSDNEVGFGLERSEDGVQFELLADLPSNTETYGDGDTRPATDYWYRVYAYNAAGKAYSETVRANSGGGHVRLNAARLRVTGRNGIIHP